MAVSMFAFQSWLKLIFVQPLWALISQFKELSQQFPTSKIHKNISKHLDVNDSDVVTTQAGGLGGDPKEVTHFMTMNDRCNLYF